MSASKPTPPGESSEPPKPPKPAADDEGETEEVGGAKGPEPTRYGDWQHKGRVSDF